jgi:hypothetical protein
MLNSVLGEVVWRYVYIVQYVTKILETVTTN